MQTRNPFIDDLTKMANGAMGALTGVKDEVEARVRDQIAKILDGMDIPAPRRVRGGQGDGRQGARGERGAEEADRRAAGPAHRASELMRVGVEVGGTFTDLVAVEGGRVVVTKVPSTPRSPDIGAFAALTASGIDHRAHRGSRPRLDGRDQRRAGAQGRGGRLRRHRGLPRPAVHAAPRPAQHLRPLLRQARAAGAPQGLLRGRRAARRRRLDREAARRGDGRSAS